MATIAEQLAEQRNNLFGGSTSMPTAPAMPTMPTIQGGGMMPDGNFDDLASSNLDKMLSSSSPLMKRAAATGVAVANRRGLMNSSIAAGASQGAMIDAAAPIAAADANAGLQKNLQKTDLAAQMQRLQISNDAEMTRLQAQLGSANEQQKRDIEARMDQLKATNDAEMSRLQEQGKITTAQQQTEIDARTGMQQVEIDAQKERLDISGQQELGRISAAAAADQERIRLQAGIDAAAQATGAEQQRALRVLEGEIQTKLQTQTDAGALERLGAQFAQNLEMQDRQSAADLNKIAASGNQDIRRTLVAAQEERQNLAMQIAAGDRERIATTATQIFAAEASIRQGLLANTNMPAAERAAYEQAISSLGNPVRDFINQLYTPAGTVPAAAQPIMGGVVPLAQPAAPAAPVATGGGLLSPSSEDEALRANKPWLYQ